MQMAGVSNVRRMGLTSHPSDKISPPDDARGSIMPFPKHKKARGPAGNRTQVTRTQSKPSVLTIGLQDHDSRHVVHDMNVTKGG